MAEQDQTEERTEEPTAKRLEKARRGRSNCSLSGAFSSCHDDRYHNFYVFWFWSDSEDK